VRHHGFDSAAAPRWSSTRVPTTLYPPPSTHHPLHPSVHHPHTLHCTHTHCHCAYTYTVTLHHCFLRPALTSGGASPRQEVLHLPMPNAFVDTTLDSNGHNCTPPTGKGGCSPSMRIGDFKIIMGWVSSHAVHLLGDFSGIALLVERLFTAFRCSSPLFAAHLPKLHILARRRWPVLP
jgi:hypothetical protein